MLLCLEIIGLKSACFSAIASEIFFIEVFLCDCETDLIFIAGLLTGRFSF